MPNMTQHVIPNCGYCCNQLHPMRVWSISHRDLFKSTDEETVILITKRPIHKNNWRDFFELKSIQVHFKSVFDKMNDGGNQGALSVKSSLESAIIVPATRQEMLEYAEKLTVLLANGNADIGQYLAISFFREVWLNVTNARRTQLINEESVHSRTLVDAQRIHFEPLSTYNPEGFAYPQQSALYESLRMRTAYKNMVKRNFGNRLRQAINVLLHIRDRRRALHAAGVAEGLSAEGINENIYRQVTSPCRRFKLAIRNRITDESFEHVRRGLLDNHSQFALDALRRVLTSYPDDYTFDQDNIYYDSKVHPLEHFKAYFRLSQVFNNLDIPVFRVFPLRQWKIVCDGVIRLNRGPFHPQRGPNSLSFRGIIYTDGVSITIQKKQQKGRYISRLVPEEPVQYIDDLTPQQLQSLEHCCAPVDLGRQDHLYCTHEDSTSNNKIRYRWTKATENRIRTTARYRRICEGTRTEIGILSRHYTATIHRQLRFSSYVRQQKSVPHQRYHEPIRSVGFRRLLRRSGFQVFLIDEFRTSRCCPDYGSIFLETFLTIANPRRQNPAANPDLAARVTCHGLLRCLSALCVNAFFNHYANNFQGFIPYCFWNSDLAACLNMRYILAGLRRDSA
ncbi:hypothetical protein BD560DRAFT_447230 [Blakeslea trispora]|nr:hypothetical protein BD560DRAFT_447230 [Blakeslea trispora]